MDYVWAPWRMQYITSSQNPGSCIFCVKAAEDRDRENVILYRSESCFAILNAYPYNPGHLMIVPYQHVSSVTDVAAKTLHDLMLLSQRSVEILQAQMSPDGFNIGINQGRPAGAGIADHVHQHIVPRWAGDTNYMTTIGNTKVLPELVTETYEKLLPAFKKLLSEAG